MLKRIFVVSLFAAMTQMACAGYAQSPRPDPVITIDNFVFTPNQVAIPVGTKVTWVNRDDVPHTIVTIGTPSGIKSPPLDTDDRFSVTFDKPGTYRYFCSIHPMMTGTIVVQ